MICVDIQRLHKGFVRASAGLPKGWSLRTDHGQIDPMTSMSDAHESVLEAGYMDMRVDAGLCLLMICPQPAALL